MNAAWRRLLGRLLAGAAAAGAACAGPALPPAPADPGPVTLSAVGDILLDRGVGRRIERHGAGFPFGAVRDLLRADVAFGNLECPLSERGTRVPKKYSFKADPSAVECLRHGDLRVLSLANNHTMDCGRRGLVDTMRHLKEKGLAWCGAGMNRDEAEQAAVVTVRGLRIGFVGFCDFLPEGSFARDDRPRIALISGERLVRAIGAARQRSDVVVASFHWGVEYAGRPSARQRLVGRMAIRSGADLVLGHHPHVLQGWEAVTPGPSESKTGLIIYSLGNFVFDQGPGRPRESIVLRCILTRDGLREARAHPVTIRHTRPEPASTAAARSIVSRLQTLSTGLKTQLRGRHVAAWNAEGAVGSGGQNPDRKSP